MSKKTERATGKENEQWPPCPKCPYHLEPIASKKVLGQRMRQRWVCDRCGYEEIRLL